MTESEPIKPSRRDMLRAALALATGPEAALKAAVGATQENPYPWIKDAAVLRDMKELDSLIDKSSILFKLPIGHHTRSTIKELVLADTNPMKDRPENIQKLDHPFWHVLSGPRSAATIQKALTLAEAVLDKEAKIEPRRKELIERIKKRSGEDPWLLRKPDDFRAILKEAIREENFYCVGVDEGFNYLKDGVALLRNYLHAYKSGTLDAFLAKQHNAPSNMEEWQSQDVTLRINRDVVKGKDYVPSAQETQTITNALKHFLELKYTRITSSTGKPAAYVATIHTHKNIRGHIKDLIAELYAGSEAARLMQIHETSNPLKEAPKAYDYPDSPGFLTISEPPRALMELIESAKHKREEAALGR